MTAGGLGGHVVPSSSLQAPGAIGGEGRPGAAPSFLATTSTIPTTKVAKPTRPDKDVGGKTPPQPRQKCPYKNCNYSALKKGTLKQHLVNVHFEGITWFPCQKEGCNYTAKRKGTLKRHMAYVHNEGITWYYCEHPFCDYKAKQRCDMKHHTLKLHSAELTSFACLVPGCSFRGKRKTLLARHMEKFHTNSQSGNSVDNPNMPQSPTRVTQNADGLDLANAA